MGVLYYEPYLHLSHRQTFLVAKGDMAHGEKKGKGYDIRRVLPPFSFSYVSDPVCEN
jgi:hypothetical protein